MTSKLSLHIKISLHLQWYVFFPSLKWLIASLFEVSLGFISVTIFFMSVALYLFFDLLYPFCRSSKRIALAAHIYIHLGISSPCVLHFSFLHTDWCLTVCHSVLQTIRTFKDTLPSSPFCSHAISFRFR